MKRKSLLFVLLFSGVSLMAGEPAEILTNHLGYDPFGPKHGVIQGSASDQFESFTVNTYPEGVLVFQGRTSQDVSVPKWRDWHYWEFDFTELEREGTYVVEAQDRDHVVRSFPFRVQKDILERATLSDVLYYFKSVRSSGAIDKADSRIAFEGSKRKPIDARGGWYDASGDYGIHMSQLDFASYFNTQQAPLVVYSLGKTRELLEARDDPNFRQIRRRLLDETAYGADFLVRMRAPGSSFYESIGDKNPEKKPEDRLIQRVMKGFSVYLEKPTGKAPAPDATGEEGQYEVAYRSGGGFAIAALAIAARAPIAGEFDKATYLKTAEEAFAFLEAHNTELLNDHKENILDDYCALVAATELLRTTRQPVYAQAAKHRADSLMGRLVSGGGYKDYWRADDRDRPFFNPSDAGAPIVALVEYYSLADHAEQARILAEQARILDVVKRSFQFELGVTHEIPNPFGLARQYVQNKQGQRRTSFFYPHDSETSPWWQGENARLASLGAAARLAAPLFADDPPFQAQLQGYALDQLNWILGLNPFDASMLEGAGRNNPEYLFFASWEYKSAPGGISNGITSGYKDDEGIDLNVPYEITHQDSDWRWAEQWLPHAAWYMLATAAGKTTAAPAEKAVIAYIFVQDHVIDPAAVAAEKLTHINYAFANIKDGVMVEGFSYDAQNFQALNSLKVRNPTLKVLVSVGGWTWSGQFSDVALTQDSRRKFVESAVAFLVRYKLDGLDVDWEFPGQEGLHNVNRPEDKENCTALMADLRAALDKAGQKAGKRYLLTMAVEAADEWLEHTEMGKVARSLDFANLMAYDQFEGGDPMTGHHAPLFTHPANPKHLSASTAVSHFIAAGVPAAKVVLGVPFYGHAWGQVPATEHGLYQPGKETRQRIAESFEMIDKLENQDGFVRYWDDISKAPLLYNSDKQLFISYDDAESIRLKGRYVADRGLGGMMFWEYSGDPKNKLLDAIHEGLTQ
jgi:GH18 family chitinase